MSTQNWSTCSLDNWHGGKDFNLHQKIWSLLALKLSYPRKELNFNWQCYGIARTMYFPVFPKESCQSYDL